MAGGQLIEQLARALARSSERQSGGAGLRNALSGFRRAAMPLTSEEWAQAPFGRFGDTPLYRGMRRPLEGDAFSQPTTKWDGTWLAESPEMASSYAGDLRGGAFEEGATVYPLRVNGNVIDADHFTQLRRESDDLADLRRRLAELNAVGMRDPNTRTWMVLDPENIDFGI